MAKTMTLAAFLVCISCGKLNFIPCGGTGCGWRAGVGRVDAEFSRPWRAWIMIYNNHQSFLFSCLSGIQRSPQSIGEASQFFNGEKMADSGTVRQIADGSRLAIRSCHVFRAVGELWFSFLCTRVVATIGQLKNMIRLSSE